MTNDPSTHTLRIVEMTRNLLAVTTLLLAAGCSSYDNSAAGNLTVTVTTLGTPDPNGYSLAVTGQAARPMASTDTTTYQNLPIGDYTVTLSGVEIGCTVTDGATRSVYQTVGNKFVIFGVNCP